jgi:hypothetical protein
VAKHSKFIQAVKAATVLPVYLNLVVVWAVFQHSQITSTVVVEEIPDLTGHPVLVGVAELRQ